MCSNQPQTASHLLDILTLHLENKNGQRLVSKIVMSLGNSQPKKNPAFQGPRRERAACEHASPRSMEGKAWSPQLFVISKLGNRDDTCPSRSTEHQGLKNVLSKERGESTGRRGELSQLYEEPQSLYELVPGPLPCTPTPLDFTLKRDNTRSSCQPCQLCTPTGWSLCSPLAWHCGSLKGIHPQRVGSGKLAKSQWRH